MIYLNNAATSYPKPDAVISAVTASLSAPPSGQLRGDRGTEQSDVMNACRERLAAVLGVFDGASIFLTSGATLAANAIVQGLTYKTGRVVVTCTEHNAILRPLYNHRARLAVAVAECDGNGYVSPDRLKAAIGAGCDAVFVNHCSNVTGAVQDLPALAAVAHECGAPIVADASQSAGCMPVNAGDSDIDYLIFTGHKGLLGPQGTGGFYAREPGALRPLLFGGTGFDSRTLRYALDGDQAFEPGTQNMPAMAGLLAALDHLLKDRCAERVCRHESRLTARLIEGLRSIGHVRVYCGTPDRQGPVVSFGIDGLPPEDVGYILQVGYDIAVRAGLHCAPLIHRFIGAGEKGTVRVSVGHANTSNDIDALLGAVGEIAREAHR